MNFLMTKNLHTLDDAALNKDCSFWYRVAARTHNVMTQGAVLSVCAAFLTAAATAAGGALLVAAGASLAALSAVTATAFACFRMARTNARSLEQEVKDRKQAASPAAAPKEDLLPKLPEANLGLDFHAGASRKISVGPSLKLKPATQPVPSPPAG